MLRGRPHAASLFAAALWDLESVKHLGDVDLLRFPWRQVSEAFKRSYEGSVAFLMVSDARVTAPLGITFEAKKIHLIELDE
jgi:hypothetical protein